jgi:hypothetical protein
VGHNKLVIKRGPANILLILHLLLLLIPLPFLQGSRQTDRQTDRRCLQSTQEDASKTRRELMRNPKSSKQAQGVLKVQGFLVMKAAPPDDDDDEDDDMHSMIKSIDQAEEHGSTSRDQTRWELTLVPAGCWPCFFLLLLCLWLRSTGPDTLCFYILFCGMSLTVSVDG